MENINQIRLDAEQVNVKRRMVNTGFDLFDFKTVKIAYLNTVFECFEQVDPVYADITNKVADQLTGEYVFCEEDLKDSNDGVWFTDASFWPYRDNSSNNLLHSITYSYTDSIAEEHLTCLSDESVKNESQNNHIEHVVAFKHHRTECVHVMGSSDTTAEIHNEIINQIFQPEIEVIIEYNTHVFKIRIATKAINNPYRNTPHNVTDVSDEHVIDVELNSDTEGNEWVSCDIPVQGPLLSILQ